MSSNYINFAIYKSGGTKILRISAYPKQAMAGSTSYILGVAPEGFRPSYEYNQFKYIYSSLQCGIIVRPNGEVVFKTYQSIATKDPININCVYM